MANPTETNRILATIIADMTAALLEGKTSAKFAGLDVSFLSETRLVLSGEGSECAKTAATIYRELSRTLRGVTTGTDLYEDWLDGSYTCVWVDLRA